ncbi:MAG: ABC transporter substrate-binding protein [Rhodoblastus sp.]|uniref:ABC transporter substrate-binding protein n=1 Tax=Rhodoblastus sp. TaxID=1962975 RepID=UPI003F98F4E3
MAAGLLLALAALSFCPPLRAQSPDVKGASDETSSTIPPETGKYATQKTDLSTAFCDASRPECQAAKRAITERIAHDAEKNAQTSQTQQPAPAAAPPAAAAPAAAAPAAAPAGAPAATGFHGLANAAAAKADENTLRFGLIAPFSGANKDFAGELKLGAEAAFLAANDAGGINGKSLRLFVADDGYDPARTPDVVKTMAEKDKVFGFISNFGSATSAAILPYVLEHKLAFFGAFSGSGLLRREPPDRYVFNYRPSYAEETEAVVRYLVRVRRLKPDEIAVFAQDDAFGDAGYAGVEKALRALDDKTGGSVLHLRYARNSIDVAAAIDELSKRETATPAPTTTTTTRGRHRERAAPQIKAVVMVATYRAAAKFIEKAREAFPDLIFTNVSAVGSNNFAEELKLLGPRFSKGIIVTQVVPDPEGFSSIALEYKAALAKYFPNDRPDYVSFESYINAKIMLEGLKKAGPQPDSDKLVASLENIHNLDLGLGPLVNFGASEHQAIHKVWGAELDEHGAYHFIDLE